MAVSPLRMSRVHHLVLPGPRSPREGVICQLHHPFDRREVRAEHAPPGLHTVLPGRTAGPATHTVDDLVNLLGRRPGLVGGVDVNLDMMRRVPHGHIGGDADQLFGLAVEQGLVAMLGLPPVVAPLEGLEVYLGQKVMVTNPEATYSGDPFLLCLLVSLCRHQSTSLLSVRATLALPRHDETSVAQCITFCRASTLAEELYRSSPFQSPSGAQRQASSMPPPAHVHQLRPPTHSNA